MCKLPPHDSPSSSPIERSLPKLHYSNNHAVPQKKYKKVKFASSEQMEFDFQAISISPQRATQSKRPSNKSFKKRNV